MKRINILLFTALLGMTLFAACDKVTADEDALVGRWWYEEYVGMPIIVTLNADGTGTWYTGPGCFGESHTAQINWWLSSKGSKVYFGAEQSDPTIEWKLREVTDNSLVVDERLRTDGKWSQSVSRTYRGR